MGRYPRAAPWVAPPDSLNSGREYVKRGGLFRDHSVNGKWRSTDCDELVHVPLTSPCFDGFDINLERHDAGKQAPSRRATMIPTTRCLAATLGNWPVAMPDCTDYKSDGMTEPP